MTGLAACMTLSEPRSSASFLTPMKPRMDPVLCCQGFEELLMWWPLDRQIILHFAEGYSDRTGCLHDAVRTLQLCVFFDANETSHGSCSLLPRL